MKRRIVSSIFLVVFLNLLIKPFWILGIDRGVQNAVGTESYGLYFALFNFSLLFNILLDLGITNFNNRNIAQHHQLLSKHLAGISILRLLLAVLYFFIGLGLAFILGYELSSIYILIHLLINQFLASFILYVRSNLSGLHLFKTDAVFSILDRIIMILICGLMLWGDIENFNINIERFIWAQSIAYVLVLIAVFIAVIRKSSVIQWYVSKAFFVMILKKSFPYALLILLMNFYFRSDSVLIERLLPNGDFQAGLYAQSFRLLDAAGMFGYLFAGILLPVFSRQLKLKQDVGDMVRIGTILLIAPLLVLVSLVITYRYELLDLLYHQTHQEAVDVLLLLMLALIPFSLNYISGTLLTAAGHLRKMNILTFSVTLLNILLNLVFIPIYGIVGAGIVALFTQVLMATLLFRRAILDHKIERMKQIAFKLLLFAILCGGVCFFLKITLGNPLLAGISSGILCTVLLFPLGLVRLKDIIRFINEKQA
ncbi:MAG TPA: oligosaccharide flippase family protein [Bacteroidia bacterium]|nr:oligosaccharide flippase family protein [Bacteroidia bacterium]HNT80199.1 oligosaccharide flippase family protein [Bacteroidia bacterium]